MADTTGIAWTDSTFNPWWGCAKVSPGCKNCYAETFAVDRMKLPIWGANAERRMMSDAHWRGPVSWNREAVKAGVRRRVFCASMADVFEDRPDLMAPRARLWKLIAETPWLDWQLLTKRPENAARLASAAALSAWDSGGPDAPTWLPNIWLGTTCENQEEADRRIPHLLRVPAVVRFLSCEPLLGPIRLDRASYVDRYTAARYAWHIRELSWIICGGESGPKARPCSVEWIREIVEQCKGAGVPVFVKQLGSRAALAEPVLGAKRFNEQTGTMQQQITWTTMGLRDKKGGDMSEWPGYLRVREFPEVSR